jgi:hypothetical protein
MMTDKTWEDVCNGSNGRHTTRAYDGTRVVVSTDPASMTVVVMRELRTCDACDDAPVAIGDVMCTPCRTHTIAMQRDDVLLCALCATSPIERTCDGGDDTLCSFCIARTANTFASLVHKLATTPDNIAR